MKQFDISSFDDYSVHNQKIRSAAAFPNRRSSLDYILSLQESVEVFEPTKGNRKRATFFPDQVWDRSDILTRRAHRGTNKYDPLSTQTSLTRKITSTELNEDKTSKQITETASLQKPPYRRGSIQAKTLTTQKAITTNKPKMRVGRTKSETTTFSAPTTLGYARIRYQNGFTTSTKKAKTVENIEDENYPEHFKALLKSQTKKNSANEITERKSYTTIDTKRSTRILRQSTTKIPVTTKETYKENTRNLRVLFPTRKSSPKTSTVKNSQYENLIESTKRTSDLNKVKYAENEKEPTIKPFFEDKRSKARKYKSKSSQTVEITTLGPTQKQMASPIGKELTTVK